MNKDTTKSIKEQLVDSYPKTHLLVLIHGFGGSPADFVNFIQLVTDSECADEIEVLAVCNSGNTGDGIVNGAKRAEFQVMKFLKEHPDQFNKISIVGHSLGGLYGRYLVYLLDQEGIFDNLEPIVFATFATPHLGVRKPLIYPLNFVFQTCILPLFQTTRELGLLDYSSNDETGETRPLLHRMTDKEYIEPLKRFKRRVLYSNIGNDFQVCYSTAAIRHRNPYSDKARIDNKATRNSSSEHRNISQWSLDMVEKRKQAADAVTVEGGVIHVHDTSSPSTALVDHESFSRDTEKLRLREMLHALDVGVGHWERYDVYFPTVFAHEQIIGKRNCFRGKSVPLHFVNSVLTPTHNAHSEEHQEDEN